MVRTNLVLILFLTFFAPLLNDFHPRNLSFLRHTPSQFTSAYLQQPPHKKSKPQSTLEVPGFKYMCFFDINKEPNPTTKVNQVDASVYLNLSKCMNDHLNK